MFHFTSKWFYFPSSDIVLELLIPYCICLGYDSYYSASLVFPLKVQKSFMENSYRKRHGTFGF